MRKILILLGLLVLALFVVAGCTTGEAVKSSKSSICSGWGKYCSALLLDEKQTYRIAGVGYKIELTDIVYQDYAGGVHAATFNVNNEEVSPLEGEEKTLSDGRIITITDFVFQDYAGGVKSVSFCLSG